MGPILLLLTTFIWGTAFLAQKYGASELGPFGMTVFRNILGGGFLLVCIWMRRLAGARRGTADSAAERTGGAGRSIWAGFCCGVPLFAAMASQQIGINWTTPGISAFLTTNYVLFVPLLAAFATRRLPSCRVCVCAFAALGGTYLICLTGESAGQNLGRIGKGEAWTILCAFFFAVQMMVVDRFSKKSDVLVMSAVQLLTCSVLGAPFLLLPGESARLAAGGLLKAWLPLVYCGVLSSGIAYTLQNFGQARTPPALAAVMLSLESVFGALSGYVVLHDRLAAAQLAGCALVFAAALLVQVHGARPRARPSPE